MSTQSPTIQQYMTPAPHVIDAARPVEEAYQLMKSAKIRHLPVVSKDRLVGLLSDRDLRLVMSFPDVNPDEVRVADAMRPSPFTVAPDSTLAEVAASMAEHKEDSAVVARNEKVLGIFTTVDACRALADLLP
ncbi:MAG: CBS domain-containing protein [Kofleriaceae bacterium]|nr:CBS domain-containing protein [Myxococcales bacterium]MCB9562926.1 CBS domain-containing protein [Kofleriaceae bacterium]MCB9572697.1 CBS domain-containing protein [Kofleriaceae bacterium]